jgi:glycolate oxidase FAD binding subunit
LSSVSELESVHAAAALIREAAGAGRSVSIERDGGDVVLSTRGLDQILEHEAGDLTCTVEAGIRLSALNDALAPHGQMLALDPPGDPTIGACLAANLSGPRRHRYGTMRDLVIGATVVLGDGTVASSGGKVVKNVAGYDLAKLFCGSEGRLGLIARVSLRLHPAPEATSSVMAPPSVEAAHAVLRSTLVPSAVDIHWPSRLALLFEGSKRAVAAQVRTAERMLDGQESSEEDEDWDDGANRQLAARGRLSFPPRALADVLAVHDQAVVRVSAGVAYVSEPVPDPRDPAEIALVERIRAQFDPQAVLV